MLSPSVQCTVANGVNWINFPSELQSKPISLFLIETRVNSNLLEYIELLVPVNEIEISKSYFHQPKKESYLINRSIVRILLSACCSKGYKNIELLPGVNGKPRVADCPNLHYSVSYSAGYMVLAIAASPIGADLEYARTDFQFQDIIDFSFSLSENDFVRQSANPTCAFYTLWTRKEALVKATAKGIDDDFRDIPSLEGSHPLDQTKLATSISWTTSSFSAGNNCIAAISYSSRFTVEDIAFYKVGNLASALFSSPTLPIITA
ncbi:4'-phosphopantetheinyl transferase family protein [Hymenobacter sp.]|jgi:4'-phosphopantetheinyl transferase|uniref:4'-phosphopantetheinyl transferase family protein n=1 Tax=Hymenobacter sp. TaxID=1898978 RepID=UPI002ED83C04